MGFCYKTGSISLGGKFRSSRNVTGLKAYLRMDMAGFKQLIHRLTGPLIRWLQDKRLIFQKLQVKPGIFAAFFFYTFIFSRVVIAEYKDNFFMTDDLIINIRVFYRQVKECKISIPI